MDPQGLPLLRQFVNVVSGYRYHWHDDLEIQLIVSGECEICVDGMIHYLVPDDLLLINAGCAHASLRHKGESLSLVTHVSHDYLCQLGFNPEAVQFKLNSDDPFQRDSAFFSSLREKLCRCLLSLQSGTPGEAIAARGYFELFLAEVIENHPLQTIDESKHKKNKADRERILSVMKFISQNYRSKLTLEETAGFACLNRSYFSTFFKKAAAIGFQDYLTRYRLQSSIIEMMDSNKSLSEIALDNGFSDIKAFNQAFKHNFHKSPSEYRKNIYQQHAGQMLHSMTRRYAQENNPLVSSYLSKYRNQTETKTENPISDPMREITFTLRADNAAANLLSQFSQAGITVSLDEKK